MADRCARCDTPETERRLARCPICFRHYCEACAEVLSGRRFCSRYCAEYFFHEGEEEEES